LTALNEIDLSDQSSRTDTGLLAPGVFMVLSPLLPILHPGLVKLDLQQEKELGPVSQFHVGRALVELGRRTPIPTLLFKSINSDTCVHNF
jgi:hypothetical protein